MPPKELDADQRLMRSFAARDPGAADTLYRRFAGRIYGLGLVMLGSDAAAQDLVQDTFVKLWRSAERYDRSRGKLETWVLLMARSLAIDAIRRRVLEVRTLEHLDHPPESDQGPGPDDQVVTLDLTERARRAMSSLPSEQRAALELAYLGGKTSAEISDLEGIPVGTAKTRIRAALLRLRELMSSEDRPEPTSANEPEPKSERGQENRPRPETKRQKDGVERDDV
jgi:RNA polymerase sigma factor (sigma-70 family)